ncbi:MAG: hypothetical protein C0392_13300, partial [Syntrophus sp. (in: bacteria)]|nr:hypothetical protein [Syntrophus sp. (in: bacteria)]
LFLRRTMSTIIALAWIIVLFLAGYVPFLYPAQAAETSNCIQCHTNEQVLKALHKPSKIETSEGEG